MKKNTYSYFPKYILRVPIKPLQFWQLQNLDLEEVNQQFQSDTLFREAISIASSDLYTKAISDGNGPKDSKILESLLKYYLRICTRCTPFGLFAGVSTLGDVTNGHSQIRLDKSQGINKHVHVDMGFLYLVSKHLSTIYSIRSNLKLFSNNTIYEIGDNIRYVEATIINNSTNFIENSLESNETLSKIIKFCKTGVRFCDIVSLLTDDGFEEKDITAYIHLLLDNHVLFSEIELSTLERDPLSRIISLVREIEDIKDIRDELEELSNYINHYSQNCSQIPSGRLVDRFATQGVIGINSQIGTTQNQISKNVMRLILEGIDVLNKLSERQSNKNLTQFKNSFFEQYEYKEVPILRVLDAELGIGFPVSMAKLRSPLIDDIRFVKPGIDSFEINWDGSTSFLMKLLGEYYMNPESGVIEISDSDLKSFNSPNEDLPDTISALVEIYRNEDGEQVYIAGLSASAANYLGRFASNDQEVEMFIKEDIYKKEEEYLDIDTIFAEISHIPEGRIGNILLRPSFTEYEIPLITPSLLLDEKQIGLDDIVVSVNNNEIILRSQRLNKRIIPRLSTAHNYHRYENLSIYKFLCSIHNQNNRNRINLNWGVLTNMPFLPRVIYKNLILFKATWRLECQPLKPLHSMSDIELEKAISEWRLKHKIPKDVVLRDADNKLYVNFENRTLTKLFLHMIKNRSEFTLEEFIFSENNGIVFDEEGDVYANEFVFSFYKNEEN